MPTPPVWVIDAASHVAHLRQCLFPGQCATINLIPDVLDGILVVLRLEGVLEHPANCFPGDRLHLAREDSTRLCRPFVRLKINRVRPRYTGLVRPTRLAEIHGDRTITAAKRGQQCRSNRMSVDGREPGVTWVEDVVVEVADLVFAAQLGIDVLRTAVDEDRCRLAQGIEPTPGAARLHTVQCGLVRAEIALWMDDCVLP